MKSKVSENTQRERKKNTGTQELRVVLMENIERGDKIGGSKKKKKMHKGLRNLRLLQSISFRQEDAMLWQYTDIGNNINSQ